MTEEQLAAWYTKLLEHVLSHKEISLTDKYVRENTYPQTPQAKTYIPPLLSHHSKMHG